MQYVLVLVMFIAACTGRVDTQESNEGSHTYTEQINYCPWEPEPVAVLYMENTERDLNRTDYIDKLTVDLYRLYMLDQHKYSVGLQHNRRVPRLSEQRRRRLATAAFNATGSYDYALHVLIIAAYESTFNENAMGDCEDRSQPHTCMSCGITQIKAQGRAGRGYDHRPNCTQLLDVNYAFAYTYSMLLDFTDEDGKLHVGRYNGTNNQPYIDRHFYAFNHITGLYDAT